MHMENTSEFPHTEFPQSFIYLGTQIKRAVAHPRVTPQSLGMTDLVGSTNITQKMVSQQCFYHHGKLKPKFCHQVAELWMEVSNYNNSNQCNKLISGVLVFLVF